jgi:hypothetical protein
VKSCHCSWDESRGTPCGDGSTPSGGSAVISGETTTGGANTAPVRSLGANECGVRLPPLRRTDVVQQQDIGRVQTHTRRQPLPG